MRFPYNALTIEKLKELPGVRYAPEVAKGMWLTPGDMAERCARLLGCQLLRAARVDFTGPSTKLLACKDLLPHQVQAETFTRLVSGGRAVIAHEIAVGGGTPAGGTLRRFGDTARKHHAASSLR